MYISLHQIAGLKKSVNNFGYSRIYHELTRTATNFGFTILKNDPRAKVQIYLSPETIKTSHYDHQYKIYFVDNESTLFPHDRIETYQNADEVWTGNYYAKDAAVRSGISAEKVFVYEHGLISGIYPKKLRGQGPVVKFLHVDSGTKRKGADYALIAFRLLRQIYGDRVELTLKYTDKKTNNISINNLANHTTHVEPGVASILGNLSPEGLVELEHMHDVMVFPTEGEGFGIIPLEALATGMPTIATHEWCSYSKYLINHSIESRFGTYGLDWGALLTGDVVVPRVSSILSRMVEMVENMEEISKFYYDQAGQVVEEYDWQKITNNFMTSFVKRMEPGMFQLRSNK